MPIEYEIQGNICRITTTGKFAKSDVDEYFQIVYRDPAFSQCDGILLHDKKSKYMPTTQDIKAVASGVRKLIGDFKGKIAIAVDSPAKYGMGRMLEFISSDPGIRVFRSQEEALEWLDESNL